MWAIRAILIVALVLAVVAFAFYNMSPDQVVDVDLIWMQRANVPIVTVVFWAFVGGVMVSLFVALTTYIKQSIQIRAARRKIRALESEVAVLRNRPIEESAELLKGADRKATQGGSAFASNE